MRTQILSDAYDNIELTLNTSAQYPTLITSHHQKYSIKKKIKFNFTFNMIGAVVALRKVIKAEVIAFV